MKALVTNQLANNYTRYGIFATDDIPDVAIDDFTYLIQVEFWYLDKCEISKSVTQTSNTTRVIGNKVIEMKPIFLSQNFGLFNFII